MKSSVLIKKAQCPSKSMFDDLKLNRIKSASSYYRDALKLLLKEPLKTWDFDKVLNEVFPDEFFASEKEKEARYQQFKERVGKFQAYLLNCDLVIHESSLTVDVPMADYDSRYAVGELAQVSADVCLRTPEGAYFLANIDFYKSPYSRSGRTKFESKKISNSMELFLLGLATQEYHKLHKLKTVTPVLYFLRSQKEKKGLFVSFNEQSQDNVVTDTNLTAHLVDKKTARWDRLHEAFQQPTTKKCESEECKDCYLNSICQYQHYTPIVAKPRVGAKKAGAVTWTPEQEAVIDFEIGICRSNAVAGAGKTTVIANRIMTLIKKGYLPSSCLLITFTDKGVREMREKIEFWLKREGMNADIIKQLNIFTFNGFGHELIKKYHARLGFTEEPILVDRIERIELIKEICDRFPMIEELRYETPYSRPDFAKTASAKGAYLALSDYFDAIKRMKTTGTLSDLEIAKELKISPDILDLYEAFEAEMFKRCLIDFDDQIVLAAHLLSDLDVVKELRLAHIIVDEFQDSSLQQLYMVQQLTEGKRFLSLMVTGDDSQSIYSWRGANQENIIRFDELFQDVKDLTLQNNFRTTKEIAALANAVNGLNLDRIDKSIVAHKDGAIPELMVNNLSSVVHRVQTAIAAGYPLGEIAVIGRRRVELMELHRLLSNAGIPNVLAVSEMLSANEQAARFIKFADYVLTQSDSLGLCEYLQLSNYEAYDDAKDKTAWFKGQLEEVDRQLAIFTEEEKFTLVMEHLAVLADIYPSCKKLKEVIEGRKFNMLYPLVSFLKKIELHDSDLAIPGIEGVDAVVLTTAHASKGREFDVVITLVSTFTDYSVLDRDRLLKEEERRLAFVAYTRAKEQLVLWSETPRHSFIQEINELHTQSPEALIRAWRMPASGV